MTFAFSLITADGRNAAVDPYGTPSVTKIKGLYRHIRSLFRAEIRTLFRAEIRVLFRAEIKT